MEIPPPGMMKFPSYTMGQKVVQKSPVYEVVEKHLSDRGKSPSSDGDSLHVNIFVRAMTLSGNSRVFPIEQ
jgi:hypothetical protein